MDASPKKGGVTSSSKSKGAATKLAGVVAVKLKASRKRIPLRLEDKQLLQVANQRIKAPKTGSKLGSTAPKTAGKSKNDDAESNETNKYKDDETSTPAAVPKSNKQDVSETGKSKQETPKILVS
ncbi:protein starmaker [Cucumis melo var. makuwa]|uniref:Protein starmaker n=2 Tax=Cucumis melo TaxID=3656 RepID=A0A5D3E5P1_CUCMM|nr:protein starmaker [Cucumis melo var. makuwa]